VVVVVVVGHIYLLQMSWGLCWENGCGRKNKIKRNREGKIMAGRVDNKKPSEGELRGWMEGKTLKKEK